MSQLPIPPILPATTFAEAEPDAFRVAIRELAGGVAVVTVGKDSDITGFTATSVTSLSTHPPRLLVCVAQSSASWKILQRYPHFVVNLLGQPDRALANRFAGKDCVEGAQRSSGYSWLRMASATLAY